MNEQSIFLAAMEITDPHQRAAYLDQACAGDPSLRQQVDALFVAHERSGEFLDVPALKQMAGASGDPNRGAATSVEHHASQEEIDLSFLQPSTAPGSLGRLTHYEIQEVIGRGGCGIVLKAFDEKLQRIVAIKIMAPELAATSPARKRFLREARATAAIRHENVVSIHAVEEQPLPFLVMEYIDGPTLQQRLDQTGPLDVREVLQIGRQIASGLEAAHAKGLIHRDIKPGNILLEDGTDHLKITDFGLARSADDASMTQSGVITGTPLYMSPEQAQAHHIDQRSDLFSLGSVLYVMCSGRPPFRAASILAVMKRVVEEQPRPIEGIIPEVPDWLVAIIARLHAKNPEERFASAQEIGDLLARCQSELEHYGRVESVGDILPMVQPASAAQEPVPHEPPTLEEKSSPAQASRSGRARGRNWAAAAVVLLVLLTGLGMIEATGVTNVRSTVIRLFSPDGTLVVEVDDPGVSVTIDGEEMVITGTGAKEIRLKPGEYKLLASKDGRVVRQELVTVTRNGRQVVRVSRETQPTPPTAMDRRPKFRSGGDWIIEDGELVQATRGFARLLFGDAEWTDYDFEVEAKSMGKDKDQGIGLLFRASDLGNNHQIDIGGWGATVTEAIFLKKGKWGRSPGCFLKIPHEHGRWYKVKIEVRGPSIHCLVDGKSLFMFNDETFLKGMIGLGTHSSAVRWRHLKVKAPDGKVLWEGFPELPAAQRRSMSVPGELQVRLPRTFTNGIGMEFVLVPKGEFLMGGGAGRPGTERVSIEHDFYLGTYEVTQEEWEQVTGFRPSAFSRTGSKKDDVQGIPDEELKRFPVETVSWDDAQLFLEMLNKQEQQTGWRYRLPTEAEWEYACRGGPSSNLFDFTWHYYFDKPTNRLLPEQANFNESGLERTCKVGRYAPNKLGLYDMHGNVREWCEDEREVNMTAQRVYRGGGWFYYYGHCRAANGFTSAPSSRHDALGLRVARVPIDKTQTPVVATLPKWQPTPEQQAFFDEVAKLPADEQLARVVEKLIEYNPGFDGKLAFQTVTARGVEEVGIGRQLSLIDLTPLRALAVLERLNCNGTGVVDLSPLEGMQLTSLSCTDTRISDLSPLKGMRLTELRCDNTRVSDLSPLHGMPLTSLKCNNTGVSDLSPLKGVLLASFGCGHTRVTSLAPLQGMPLTNFNCEGTRVSDLSPLEGMPLTQLICQMTRVSDLSPLEGMPLTYLDCSHSPVADLSPLTGMPLTRLICEHNRVYDLAPLQGMPLKSLGCSFTRVSDLSPLKGLPLTYLRCLRTRVSDVSPLEGMLLEELYFDVSLFDEAAEQLLKTLPVRKPAAEFWEGIAARRTAAETFAAETAKLPLEDQVAAVTAKLKELNNGQVGLGRVVENGAVAQVTLTLGRETADITPLLAFTKLKTLTLTGGPYWLDISCVSRLPLEELTCSEDIALKNATVLQTLQTLKTINDKPAAEFWKDLEAGKRFPAAAVGSTPGQWLPLLNDQEQFARWSLEEGDEERISFADGELTIDMWQLPRDQDLVMSRPVAAEDAFIVHAEHSKEGFNATLNLYFGDTLYHIAHFGRVLELWRKRESERSTMLIRGRNLVGHSQWGAFDVVVLDGKLTAFVDGEEIYSFSVEEKELTKIALLGRQSTTRWRNVAIMSLTEEQARAVREGELPTWDSPARDYDTFAKGKWVPVLTTEEEFRRFMAEQEEGLAEKFRYDNGVLECDNTSLRFPAMSGKNLVIRSRVKYESGQHVNLRMLHPEAEYVAWWNFGGRQFGIGKYSKPGAWRPITGRGLPEDPPAFFEYALTAVNGKLTAYVDGNELYEIDMPEEEGQNFIPGLGTHNGVGLFKNIEIMVLDEVQPADDRQTSRVDPDAVRQDLRRLNPEFQGAITYFVEGGQVVRWTIVGGMLEDLSPLLVLKHLQQLNYEEFDPERDAPVVTQLPSLEKINEDSAAAYRLAYPATKPPPGVSDEWLETVSKLPVKSRVPVVIEKVQELNPNFDGKHWFREGDMFLKIESMAVTDLSPLKALPELRQLVCSGLFGKRTWLADLSPLSGTPLTRLECANTRVADLAPLKGMPLETLILAGTPVADLGPLTGMPLTKLHVNGTQVEDLGPVADAKLQYLSCDSTKIADLTPLNGMPLAELYCYGTPISDLSPLRGAPLRILSCWRTSVSDLTPLAGMPLKELYCFGTRVSDLSPLKGMQLAHLECGHSRVSDLSPLRGMALRQLNVRETEVADLAPLAGMGLIELYCANSSISDLSPLKGLRLTHLEVNGTTVNDLSPLEGAPLTFLRCNDTQVTELSPVKGMPLEMLWIPNGVSEEDLGIIRGIESLKQINGQSAAEFWKTKTAP